MSGYNVFISQSMKGGKTMSEAVGDWKVLSKKEKDEWNAKAKKNASETKEKTTNTRKIHKKK